MKIIIEDSITLLRVKQILDLISIFKGHMVLANVSLIGHVHGEPMYKLEYVEKDE